MAELVLCKECVFLGVSAQDTTPVCRRNAPRPSPAQPPPSGYVPATWAVVDPERDSCGQGVHL